MGKRPITRVGPLLTTLDVGEVSDTFLCLAFVRAIDPQLQGSQAGASQIRMFQRIWMLIKPYLTSISSINF